MPSSLSFRPLLIEFTFQTAEFVIINAYDARDITLPAKVCIVRTMVFPVIMYGYESWPIKKAEHQRFDAFEMWCWRRLLSLKRTLLSLILNYKEIVQHSSWGVG